MSAQQKRLAAISAQLHTSKNITNTIARSVVNLDKNWLFKQSGFDAVVPDFLPTARFPTDVYSDLLHNSIIQDPLRGMNEQDVQWVSEKTWVYQTSFSAPKSVSTAQRAVLFFEGLDTYAIVKLNGVEILRTENMFIRYEVDVNQFLQPDVDNTLEIVFENAMEKAEEVMRRLPDHKWGTMGGEPKRTAVRKAQYHFGWDWGPRLVTCGPWKPIRLEIYNSKIVDVYARPVLDDCLGIADIEVTTSVDGEAGFITFELSLDEKQVAESIVQVVSGVASTKIRVKSPALWWPFTHGAQPLYTLHAKLSHNDREFESSSVRFGIRKVELVQQPLLDQDGTSFFLRINNVPLFISGSCWIPADSLTTRITPQKYHNWVSLARNGNQSMIRVWGGGIFEHAALYNACDELGVLVWQDFMFACGNYPTTSGMLESIKVEAEQNVTLLRNHPSIVLWAGNNEDYLWVLLASLEYDPENKDPQSWLRTNFPARYIYEYLLPEVCKILIPDVPYHPGSPFGGSTAMDPEVGDLHQWGVWHMAQAPYQDYPKMGGRFVSEFGMQALPVRRSVDDYFGDSDAMERTVESEIVRWHNKSDGAEDRLNRYLNYNFRKYDMSLDNHIYHTQLLQSEAIGTAYRSWKRDWRGPSREYCGGVLVWQLNDCWPVTSWAIADFYLRPKMAFWAIKRESSPLTVGLARTGEGGIEAWAVNLTLLTRTVDVLLKMWDVRDGRELLSKVICKDFVLRANRSSELTTFALPEGLQSANVVLAAYLLESGSAAMVARYVNFHEPLKEVPFNKENSLSARLFSGEGDSASIELCVDVPMKGVLVEVNGLAGEDVSFDDNGVDLVPGETVRLEITGGAKLDQVKLSLRWLGGSRNFN